MILKAGTYTFNNTLTEGTFEQSIDISISLVADDVTATFRCSKLQGLKYDYFGLIGTFYSVIADGEENLTEETEIGVYGSGNGGWQLPIQIHTITDDTDVSNTFAAWYIANTDYVEINGGEVPDIPDIPEEPDEPEPTKISFLINRNGTKYLCYAEEGMTWREWASSDYNNTALGVISGDPDYIAFTVGQEDVLDVGVDDVIVDGQTYYTIVDEPEEPEEPEEPDVPEVPEEPETPTKKFTRLYLGKVAYSSNGKRWRRLQTEEYIEPSEPEETLEAGLYDADDNLVASWDTLVNTYGMDVEKGYASGSWNTDPSSPYSVLKNNIELANGVKLIISNRVTSICDYAFHWCDSLSSIVIPNSVTSIGQDAFSYCSSLTSITIPDSVTSIGNYAFDGCSSLTRIEVDSNNGHYKSKNGILYSKDEKTLVRCPQKKDGISFEIPNSVTSIGYYAFEGCSFTSIVIPDSVTDIENGAFRGCSFTSIEIPNSVTSIDFHTFEMCRSLTSITIPNSVTRIGDYAFDFCSSLKSVTLPNSLTSIGEYAFRYCTALIHINFEGTMAQWGAISQYWGWNYDVPATYVKCTDGHVAL